MKILSSSAGRPAGIPRRGILTLGVAAAFVPALAACSSASEEAASGESAGPVAPEDIVLVQAIRSLSNPYHANWVVGAELFAESIGMQVQVLSDDGDSQKQLSQIRALLSQDKTVVLNVDPNTSSDAQAIVNAVTGAGGYVVTQWNKPDDLHPWDVSDRWVAHIGFDGAVGGKDIADQLFAAMGGSGGIIALQGILDNVPAQQRYAGLEAAMAEAPDIQLLDQQTADWDRATAFDVTQTLLAKHGSAVTGIWAANDGMALGALEALSAAGLAGQVPVVGIDAVPEALEALQDPASGYVATVSSDAYWQGGAATALAYMAAIGEYDVAAASEEEREFYGTQFLVTAENVGDFLAEPVLENYQADFDDPLARSTGGSSS